MRLFLPLFLVLLAACGEQAAPAQRQGPPRIVASSSIPAELARRLAGPDAEVISLLGPGADPHHHQVSARDVALLGEADLVIAVAPDFETWLPGLTGAGRIHWLAGPSCTAPHQGHEHHHEHPDTGGHAHHDHGSDDRHLWLDPLAWSDAAASLAGALATRDPGRRSGYIERATAVQAELAALHEELMGICAPLPMERRLLVTGHPCLGPFARRFGFTVLGHARPPGTAHDGEPAAAHLAELAGRIRDRGLTAVFPEEGHDDRLLRTLAGEAGCRLAPALPTCALTAAHPDHAALLRHIATVVVAELQR